MGYVPLFICPPQKLIVLVSGGTWTNETLTAVLKTHITTEVTHYKGQCYAWDVVNEALNDDATFRTDVFYNALGEDYIRIAFETAAAADPDVKLYYNDYNIETAGAKATAALDIVKTLQAAGTKIDGVGFQGHFIVGSSPSKASLVSNLEAFTALGVEVALTELDIRMTLPSTTALLTQQSTDYENAVGACVAVANCVGVTVWDFDDKVSLFSTVLDFFTNSWQYSWVPSTFPGTGAACLFDEDLNRKPAYYGVVSALSGAKQSAAKGLAATATSSSLSATRSSTAAAVLSPSGMTTSYIAFSTPTVTSSATSSTISPSASAAAVEPEEDDTCEA